MRKPPPPIPTPDPTTLRQLLRELAQVRPAPPQRWAFALRAALAMGLPILVGIWLDDIAAGLIATLGAFTALYCAGRPYASRAITLAGVACAFALAVMFGLWLERWPWLIVPVLSVVAMLATWLCNAVRLGPPGAYMFVLVCAAGTALPAEHIEVWQAGALVLGGGAGAWVLHTVGVLIQLRGPERQAVAAAGRAVVAWLQASSAQHVSRHAAARALQDSWQMLVGFQPIPARPGGELERLRAVNRELHLLFASTLAACWDTERNLCEGDDERTPIVHLRADDMPQVNRAIEALSQSLSCLTPPPVLGPLPELLHADLTDLHGFVLRQLPALRDHVSSRRPPR